jgi:hypothetical protein
MAPSCIIDLSQVQDCPHGEDRMSISLTAEACPTCATIRSLLQLHSGSLSLLPWENLDGIDPKTDLASSLLIRYVRGIICQTGTKELAIPLKPHQFWSLAAKAPVIVRLRRTSVPVTLTLIPATGGGTCKHSAISEHPPISSDGNTSNCKGHRMRRNSTSWAYGCKIVWPSRRRRSIDSYETPD